jgi:hypothetical protein
VIEAGSAVVEDTRFVWGPFNGINSNRNGSTSDSISKSGASADISMAADLEATSLSDAASLGSVIGISILRGDSVVLNVTEGIIHESSTASVVAIENGTVNKLLLREGLKSTESKLAQTFKTTSGGECPT